ncbi:hypothetical protein [Patulibacter minatonensis]|uniref:hypothetical protein n=1 Tax=Patulibacter minatonensis TaxID=298163 RepID=UPI00047E851C|nr:hypothetical protein [Patulibacter minatonensis]
MRGAPADEDATRGAHLTTILRTTSWRVGVAGTALALGAVGAVVGAGSGAGPAVAAFFGGAAVGLLLVLGIAFAVADGRAASDFWAGLATATGLQVSDRDDLPELTPLLAAGDRRNVDRWLEGTLDGHPVGLGHYTYEERHRDSKGNTSWTRYPHTVCLVDLEQDGAPSWISGVYLLRKGSFMGMVGGESRGRLPWRVDRKKLESAEFDDRFKLFVQDGVDEVRLRELFSPSFLVELIDHPQPIGFELHAGALLVNVDDYRRDAAGLTDVLEATRAIARRIADEIAEHRATSG